MSDTRLLTQSEARKMARDYNEDGNYPNGMANIATAVPAGSWGGHEDGWTVSLIPSHQHFGGIPDKSLAAMSVAEIQTELNWLARRVAGGDLGKANTPRRQRLEAREQELTTELARR